MEKDGMGKEKKKLKNWNLKENISMDKKMEK